MMKPRRERKTVDRFEAGDAGTDLKRKRQALQRHESQPSADAPVQPGSNSAKTEHKPAQAITDLTTDPPVGASVRVSIFYRSDECGLLTGESGRVTPVPRAAGVDSITQRQTFPAIQ